MAATKAKAKALRFAALIRVSTEKQAKKGESLTTQRTQIDSAVESLEGKVVSQYAGQEHGTAGYERAQLAQLLSDAASTPRPFDGVIVADATRWSRDNVASEKGLEVLRDAGVRFFVLTTEYDLFKPEARLFLGLSATIGAFHARSQKLKSMQNQIERAKRGLPSVGKKPFGRIWKKEEGRWELDETKLEMVKDVASRYIAGESLPKLAKEYRQNHANLTKILRERCGEEWTMTFVAKDLNIDETVTINIPPLLHPKTIKAVQARLEANRTYMKGTPRKHENFLLGGRIYCAECGYAFFPQVNKAGRRYYRHAHTDRLNECPLRPRPWVLADLIEQEVASKLFDVLGNPKLLEQANRDAVPDSDKLIAKRDRINAELAKVERGRLRLHRVLAGLGDDETLTDAQASKTLVELKEREANLRTERQAIEGQLADVPDGDELRTYFQRDGEAIVVYDQKGNPMPGGNDVGTWLAMGYDDKRHMILATFNDRLPDGAAPGVYVGACKNPGKRGKRYEFVLRGRAIPVIKGVTSRAYPMPSTRGYSLPFLIRGAT